MRTLAVTSFAPDMLADGARLIQSAASRLDADLLVCGENLPSGAIPAHPRLRVADLRDSATLRHWLAVNADIIPDYLGGSAVECACGAASDFQGHAAGCHWFWFNRNASRWFRKIAALDIAFQCGGYDAVIWLDSDCRIKRNVGPDTIGGWFGGASVFYLRSPFREAIESGILGMRTDAGGARFFDLTLDRFVTGAFRAHPRWDDGYQFLVTVLSHPEIQARDLATRVTGGSHVLPNSPLASYISHNKGAHRRTGAMR